MRSDALVRLTLPVLLLASCATAPDAPSGPPDYSAVATSAAPPNAQFYVDCFRQAIAAESYRAADDGDGAELILFTCTGAPARALFGALGPWSARIGSEFAMEGRIARSTARVERNLYGVDYCSALNDADHRCVITFNAGDFLNGRP